MRTSIRVGLIALLIIIVSLNATALDFRTRYNPFTNKLDYYSLYTSSDNATVDNINIFGSINSTNPDERLWFGKRTGVFDSVQYFRNATQTWTDITAEAGTSWGTVSGDILDVINDSFYVGKTTKFSNINIDIGTAKSATGTLVFEYSQAGGNWSTLNVTDGTSGLTVDGLINFTQPSDWSQEEIIGETNNTLYWVRIRVESGTFTAEPTIYLAVPNDRTDVISIYANGNDVIPTLQMTSSGEVCVGYDCETLANSFKFRANGGGVFNGALTIAGAITGVTSITMTGALATPTTIAASSTITQSTVNLVNTSRTAGLVIQSSTASNSTVLTRNSPMSFLVSKAWETANASQITLDTNFSFTAKEATPQAMLFCGNGSYVWILGDTGNDITAYNITTKYNLNTAVFDREFSVASQDATPVGIALSYDEKKFWVLGRTNIKVFEYNMTSACNIASAAYTGNSFDHSSEEITGTGVWISNDGYRMYIVGTANDRIYQYYLSTPNFVSTANYTGLSLSVVTQDTAMQDIVFSEDESIATLVGNTGDDMNMYIIGTPGDISTGAYKTLFFPNISESTPIGADYADAGRKICFNGQTLDRVFCYNLTVPYRLDTVESDIPQNYYSYVTATSGFPTTSRLIMGYSTGTTTTGPYGDYWSFSSGGNFGIGTLNPQARLDVHGAGSDGGITAQFGPWNTNIHNFRIYDNGFVDINGSVNITKGELHIFDNLHIMGNVSMKRPYGTFTSNSTQNIASANTPHLVSFNVLEDAYQINKINNTNFTFDHTGDYQISISAIVSSSVANKHVDIWLRKDGVDVPRSNNHLEIVNVNAEHYISVQYIVDMNTTNNLQVMWGSDSTGMSLVYTANSSYAPESPSIVMTIGKWSEITNGN